MQSESAWLCPCRSAAVQYDTLAMEQFSWHVCGCPYYDVAKSTVHHMHTAIVVQSRKVASQKARTTSSPAVPVPASCSGTATTRPQCPYAPDSEDHVQRVQH